MTVSKKRKEQAAKKLEDEKKKRVVQEEQATHMKRLRKNQLAVTYVTKRVKGLWYLERCNILTEQIEKARESGSNFISEMLDGRHKTLKYAELEYHIFKISAIQLLRDASFARADILEMGFTDADIKEVEEDFLDKPILRVEYNDEYRRDRKYEILDG